MHVKCAACGRQRVAAKILGKYYCYECGSRLVREHIARLLKELEKKGLVKIS